MCLEIYFLVLRSTASKTFENFGSFPVSSVGSCSSHSNIDSSICRTQEHIREEGFGVLVSGCSSKPEKGKTLSATHNTENNYQLFFHLFVWQELKFDSFVALKSCFYAPRRKYLMRVCSAFVKIANERFFPAGMMYPCRMHPELCVAMDTLSYHSSHLYTPDSVAEPLEMNHHCYLDPDNSPV